ncbi:hypothetical protein [Sideroxydans sp. CL21]|nr:hypothetical protein [Sideroxydans sp. CL21]
MSRDLTLAQPTVAPSPASGITSDLAAVFCSLVEWLVVLPRGLGRGKGYGNFIIIFGYLP